MLTVPDCKLGSRIQFTYAGKPREGVIDKFFTTFMLVKLADNHWRSFSYDKIEGLKVISV